MENIWSVLTLENGELQLPFENIQQFSQTIENLTGILSCSQQYYKNGYKLFDLSYQYEINSFQVIQSKTPASLYFIQSPSHQFQISVQISPYMTLKLLLYEINQKCKSLNISYPSANYSLFLNSILLPFSTKLSDIPHNSTLELRFFPCYPELLPIKIHMALITGRTIDLEVYDFYTVEHVKQMMKEAEGFNVYNQKLIFNGKQLENLKCLGE